MRAAYLPTDLEFSRLKLGSNYAVLEFNIKEKKFYIIQRKGTKESSINYQSDSQNYITVKNKWLGQTIMIRKEETQMGGIRFETNIANENNVCICLGDIDEDEFRKIIENLSY